MAAQQKIVECSICGHKMVIPPQYANTPGRCTVCGATVNLPAAPPVGQAPKGDAPATAPAAAKAPDAPKKKRIQINSADVASAARLALFWGALGSAGLGLTLGLLYGAMRQLETTPATFASGLLEGTVLGVPIGLAFGATWGIIRDRELASLGGAVVGLLLGAVMSGVYHFADNLLVAPSDLTLFPTCAMGALAGGFFGFVGGNFAGRD